MNTIRVGDSASCELMVTPEVIEAFVAFSGDDNDLHVNADFARAQGFADRVAHGMIALSMISRLIGTRLPGDGALWLSQELQFVEAVVPGDHLRATVVVEKYSAAAGSVILRTEVVKIDPERVVLRGRAGVRMAGRAAPARTVDGQEQVQPVASRFPS
jgi:3-oxoacyl-[acyl-carrier protein] reductase